MRLTNIFVSVVALLTSFTVSQNCGSRFDDSLCPNNLCCSQYGSCGTTADYCLTSKYCQSGCVDDGPPPPPKGPPAPLIDVNSLYRPPSGTFDRFEFVGYWSSWAQYYGEDPEAPACRKDDIHLPENINPFLFTHINYAFVFISNINFTIVPHEVDDEDLGKRLNDWMKSNNPSSRTSLSVGGWTMNDGPSRFTGGIDYSQTFSRMVSTRENRQTFIASCIDWCRRIGFDGIDIDWEYVGDTSRGGSTQDGENFLTLIKEMRQAFRDESSSTGRPELLITVAAPADPDKFDLFDPKAVSEYLDWYNVMSYDFYGNWQNVVDSTAPVFDTYLPKWSFDSALHLYLDAGIDPKKLMAGLPAYGRVWTLNDISANTPGSLGGIGVRGRCTGLTGYMAWFEIDEIRNALDRSGLAEYQIHSIPNDGAYMTFDDQWVGYDDEASIAQKMSLIKSYGLRGGMLWAIDLDTKDYSFTRSILGATNLCPQNGDWRPTAVGNVASLPCTQVSGPGVREDAAQQRQCNQDGTWSSVDLRQCQGAAAFNILARQCVV